MCVQHSGSRPFTQIQEVGRANWRLSRKQLTIARSATLAKNELAIVPRLALG